MVNERTLIRKITAKLADELEVYFRAAQFARAEATHEQNKAEHKYDTRGLEASYLARGQSRQAAEIEAAIAEFEQAGRTSVCSRANPLAWAPWWNSPIVVKPPSTSSAPGPAVPKCSTTTKRLWSLPRNRPRRTIDGPQAGRPPGTQFRRRQSSAEIVRVVEGSNAGTIVMKRLAPGA